MEVVEIPIEKISVKFRLRTPSESKIKEIAESIQKIELLNPITLDSKLNLIAGYHRLLAFKLLGRQKIPSILKESEDKTFNELMEIDENLKRNELNHIEVAEHIVKREELLSRLGLTYSAGDNNHTKQTNKLTIEELADGIGVSKRSYQQRKQIFRINEEVRSLLVETEFSNSLVDLVKLSSESEEIQMAVCNLLITGKCRTWKMAFFNAKLSDYKLKSPPRHDFNFKERFGDYPKSIMKFKKLNDDLRNICNLVNHDEDLRHVKGSIRFGETAIKLHQMNPEQAVFALEYYTNEGDTICDPFNGRATTAITSLHLRRKFVGWEINPSSFNRTREVLLNNMDNSADNWELFNGCGCEMKEYAECSEVFDAVFSSPPYYLKAEPYNDIEGDLCNMDIPSFDKKIDEMFGNLSRLIKRSNYKERVFKPIIMVLGTARDGVNGIHDMSFTFQEIAKKWGLTLWDQMFVELNNPHVWTSLQRNYELKFVHKNYESQMVWVKF
jgi:ParB family chromosome partitioning protein